MERLRRAEILAEEKGVTVSQIAMAYIFLPETEYICNCQYVKCFKNGKERGGPEPGTYRTGMHMAGSERHVRRKWYV